MHARAVFEIGVDDDAQVLREGSGIAALAEEGKHNDNGDAMLGYSSESTWSD